MFVCSMHPASQNGTNTPRVRAAEGQCWRSSIYNNRQMIIFTYSQHWTYWPFLTITWSVRINLSQFYTNNKKIRISLQLLSATYCICIFAMQIFLLALIIIVTYKGLYSGQCLSWCYWQSHRREFHPVHLMNVEQCLSAADRQTKPTNLYGW